MSVEDKQTLREVTREMNRRRNIDVTDTRFSVTRGVAYIGGIIRPSLGEIINPKTEAEAIKDSLKRIPTVKDVIFDAKFEISTKN